MKKTTTKLTETQKAFAAENHNLVYEFLRSKGLSDDFYDTVIFRYLHAVQIYDERPKLQKYNFKTIAFNNMRSALGHHYEKQQRMKRNATVLSFDAIGKNNLPLSETTAGGTLVYEYAEMKDAWNQVDSVLTQNQRNTVSLRAQGYSGNEIAQVFRLAPSSVYGRLQLIRKKAKQIAA